jgi:dynein heavy chain 1
VFSPINYSGDAILVRDTHGQPLVSLPDSLSRSAFEGWIKSLPDSNPPSWIGLPSTAERQLKRHIAQKALSHLAIVNGLAELESASQEHVAGAGDAQLRPQRKQLMETLNHWLSLLTGKDTTQQIDSVIGALSSISTVLGRTLLREAMNAKKVLRIVSHDLLAMR